ncbi:MAG: hypothetical protein WBD78_02995 [Methylocella sp.]
MPPVFPDRLPETRRARFVSLPLSLSRSCQTPVKTTTAPWSSVFAPTRAPPLAGLKTIRSPTGFSPDKNCARPRRRTGFFSSSETYRADLDKGSRDDEKRKTPFQSAANQFHREPYPKLVMVIKPYRYYKDRHDLVPLPAPARSLKALAKILPKSRARYPRKKAAPFHDSRACLQSYRGYDDIDRIYHGGKARAGFFMTGGDAARSFEFAEEILNQMTPFVVLPVVCAAAFCSLARRDDRFDFPCGEEVAHFVGVKGLVAEKRAASDTIHEHAGEIDAVTLAGNQHEGDEIAQSIGERT